MRRLRLITALLSAICILSPAKAQDAGRFIGEDISRCAGQLHSYEAPARGTKYSRPPRGYKPFYVSHFSRHGSRYHTSDKFSPTLEAFARMDSLGLLTDSGRMVRHLVDSIALIHEDKYGELTEKGRQEHRGIAQRMMRRERRLLRSRKRNQVLAVSSTVHRCQESMYSFCEPIRKRSRFLEFEFVSNEHTDSTLTRIEHGGRNPALSAEDRGLEMVDSVKRARLVPLEAGKRFFTDPAAAKECMDGGDWHLFMYNLISHGVIEQCLDRDTPQYYSLFTFDELLNYCAARSAACMNAHGYTLENGEVLRRVGALMVRDLLEKADEAFSKGSRKAADLRFSHDGGILPLMLQLDLEGCPGTSHVGEEWEKGWIASQQIPMATNLQFVFYRNRKGDVIVKILHNERETFLRSLSPDRGAFYSWPRLREELEKLSVLYY